MTLIVFAMFLSHFLILLFFPILQSSSMYTHLINLYHSVRSWSSILPVLAELIKKTPRFLGTHLLCLSLECTFKSLYRRRVYGEFRDDEQHYRPPECRRPKVVIRLTLLLINVYPVLFTQNLTTHHPLHHTTTLQQDL